MRYRFIDAEKALYPIWLMCRVLEVAASGYYAWRNRGLSTRARSNERLLVEIKAIHRKSRGTYGSPRVHRELSAPERTVSRHRVARLMRSAGIHSKHRRKFRITTQSSHSRPIAENLVNRQFSVERPNLVWVGDITYIRTEEGWLYLATVIDLFSRAIVGWSAGERLTDDLALAALRMALVRRRPEPGLIYHSDRGSQYGSLEYRRLLKRNVIAQSMSRARDCWDNAVAESFFATLKKELIGATVFTTRCAARRELTDFIEGFYNCERLHSTLGYESPFAFEARQRMKAGA